MFDRLISGAGAVTDAADRLVRAVARDGGGRFASRPGGLIVAGALGVVAVLFAAIGFEAAGGQTLRVVGAGDLAAGDPGDRRFVTVEGEVATAYIETFGDLDADGEQDPGEDGEAWYYFIVDPTTHAGLTVRSDRPPAETYRETITGLVVDDPAYVAEDIAFVGADLEAAGLTLDPAKYIDATAPAAAAATHDLAMDLPAAGTAVSLTGSRFLFYVTSCSTGPGGDGVCSDEEADLADVYLYDPGSGRAVTVLTDADPSFMTRAMTGVLRHDERSVSDAASTDGFDLDELGISVSPAILLDEGAEPPSSPLLFGLAAAAAVLAAVIVLGWRGGYLVFRPSGGLPPGASTLGDGERLPLRVTGRLRSGAGLVHVREVPADLVRFVLDPDVAATTLIVERRGRPEGVALGIGEATALETGVVRPMAGTRPAIRVTAGTGPLLLSFDTLEVRDRAAAELIDETGIGGTT